MPREHHANSRVPSGRAAPDKHVQKSKGEKYHETKYPRPDGGAFHEVKGKIKEKAGEVTNNPNLENEGTVEKTAGKVQNKVGQVEKVLGV